MKFLIGGPSNSGKSTFVLSLVEYLRSRGIASAAHELDVWSNSYVAFRGEVSFADRPKRMGLDWDWKTPLQERLDAFNADGSTIVFGDLPGKIDEAIAHVCAGVRVDGALVVSRTLDGIRDWQAFFEKNGVTVAQEFLTFQDKPPLILVGMNRNLDPNHDHVVAYGDLLLGKIG